MPEPLTWTSDPTPFPSACLTLNPSRRASLSATSSLSAALITMSECEAKVIILSSSTDVAMTHGIPSLDTVDAECSERARTVYERSGYFALRETRNEPEAYLSHVEA